MQRTLRQHTYTAGCTAARHAPPPRPYLLWAAHALAAAVFFWSQIRRRGRIDLVFPMTGARALMATLTMVCEGTHGWKFNLGTHPTFWEGWMLQVSSGSYFQLTRSTFHIIITPQLSHLMLTPNFKLPIG